MSTYTATIRITPICTSCGNELVTGLLQSASAGHPFDRDDPSSRTDQRLFVSPCPDCFIYKNNRDEIAAAYAAHQEGGAA